MPSSLAAAVAATAAKTTATTTTGSSTQQGATILGTPSSSSSYPPYFMCSRQECQDREKWGQVSVWEATAETRHLCNAKHRRMDPSRAVKKYRRSAAGTTSQLDSTASRSVSQLRATVDHLVHLIATMGKFNDDIDKESLSTSFVDLVNFVEDRIRAVQVDLILLQSPSMAIHSDDVAITKQIQYRLIKVHILILYLLSDVSATTTTTANNSTQACYSHKFGHQALVTALSNYWGGDNNNNDDYTGRQDQTQRQGHDDEVLSYMAMYELHKDLDQKDFDGHNCCLASNILALYRKHIGSRRKQTYPLFQWTMQVIVACNLGHWHVALKMLYQKGRQYEAEHDEKKDRLIMFGNLIRCALAMAPGSGGGAAASSSTSGTFFASGLFKLRRQALRAYNVSFRKQEAVCGQDAARLLLVCMDNCKMKIKNSIHAATAWGDDDDDVSDGKDKRQSDSSNCEDDKNSDTWLDAKRAVRIGRAVGLPVNHDQTALVFKAAPITEPRDSSFMQDNRISGRRMSFIIRDDDAFVLAHDDSLRYCHHASSFVLAVPSESWIRKLLSS